tara:strand:+ start:317 stop:661 length:345 start_codon:yes stop_codon:yes gene_type:complete
MIRISSGRKHEKQLIEKTIKWCMNKFRLKNIDITVRVDTKYKDCWGSCIEGSRENSYIITVVNKQTIRDFVATIVHEMVHVKQYQTGKWKGDGEREAEKLQYKLTDKLWKENIL